MWLAPPISNELLTRAYSRATSILRFIRVRASAKGRSSRSPSSRSKSRRSRCGWPIISACRRATADRLRVPSAARRHV